MIDKVRSIGLTAKGAVYIIVGGLTAASALQLGGGEEAGKSSTIGFIAKQPFGKVLLGILALGVFAYALWRIYAFFVDPKDKGSDAKAWAKRSYSLVSAAIYGGFGISVVKAALGGGSSGGGDDEKQDFAAKLLDAPAGAIILGAVGVAVFGFALYQLSRAYNAKFMDSIRVTDPSKRDMIEKSGRAGYAARGAVFGVMGYFVVTAAITKNPDMIRGTEGAFGYLHEQSYGAILMGVVAVGLLLYGVYGVMKGLFTNVPHDEPDASDIPSPSF